MADAELNSTPLLLRIRLHGRGGHGVKTAGRIVGTAAFRSGFQAQDAPMYGAERRGAAVASFVRISDRPILERGPIANPDLIVLADETLMRDPTSGVLAGQVGSSGLFINTTVVEPLVAEFHLPSDVQSFDISGRTKEILGRGSAVSAGLAAAATRLTGLVSRDVLLDAMREEFGELGVSAADIAMNLLLASEVYAAVRPVEQLVRGPVPLESLATLVADEPRISTPSILAPGNAVLRHTGGWRLDRPVLDVTTCTRCGLCFAQCPDGAIRLDEQGFPVIDYDHCKGCMICQRLCPLHAIDREPETRAW